MFTRKQNSIWNWKYSPLTNEKVTSKLEKTKEAMLIIAREGGAKLLVELEQLRATRNLRSILYQEITQNTEANIWKDIEILVFTEQIEYVVFHHFHSSELVIPEEFILQLKSQPHRPTVAFSGGDAFMNGLFATPLHPKSFKVACSQSDIVFNTSMGKAAKAIRGYGASHIALLPNAVITSDFSGIADEYHPEQAEFDVCFIGSNNRSRNPFSGYFWAGRYREKLVKRLTKEFGSRFAVFGNGWQNYESNQGSIAFEDQIPTCRRAKVVIGGFPYSKERYYLSDRPFIQISSGVPFVDFFVEGTEKILRDGHHWHLARSIDGLVLKVNSILSLSDDERASQGAEAARFILANHTVLERWNQLLLTLESVRTSILSNEPYESPNMDFFLGEVDLDHEKYMASIGWE